MMNLIFEKKLELLAALLKLSMSFVIMWSHEHGLYGYTVLGEHEELYGVTMVILQIY